MPWRPAGEGGLWWPADPYVVARWALAQGEREGLGVWRGRSGLGSSSDFFSLRAREPRSPDLFVVWDGITCEGPPWSDFFNREGFSIVKWEVKARE